MDDNELITTVRRSLADVHAATPVGQIIGRGRRVRARRQLPVAAGALVVAAGTAVAVASLPSAGHSGSDTAHTRLAAWTVATKANGDINVTINQLKDPAGLQATLRADGLPVTVSYSYPPLNPACQPYGNHVLSRVANFSLSDGSAYLVIHPSALPTGVGISIRDRPGAATPAHPHAGKALPAGITGPLAIGLVHTSQQCTG